MRFTLALFAAATILAGGAKPAVSEPTHGIAMHGEPALPADYHSFPYANPDAPKGGEISEAIPNSSNFDNLNTFSDQGRPAALAAVVVMNAAAVALAGPGMNLALALVLASMLLSSAIFFAADNEQSRFGYLSVIGLISLLGCTGFGLFTLYAVYRRRK